MLDLNKTMITDGEINAVWGNANFGTMSRIDVVKYNLLKIASGYDTGHIAKTILFDLGLLNRRNSLLTKRGKYCLYAFFNQQSV